MSLVPRGLEIWILVPDTRRDRGTNGLLAEFRRKVLDMLASGKSVASIALPLNISDQTTYSWRRKTGSIGASGLV